MSDQYDQAQAGSVTSDSLGEKYVLRLSSAILSLQTFIVACSVEEERPINGMVPPRVSLKLTFVQISVVRVSSGASGPVHC